MLKTRVERQRYHTQDGCHNCKHHFRFCDYDQGYDYYCNKDKNRPPANSTAMGELKKERKAGEKIWFRAVRVWDRWAQKHDVSPWGICKFFEKGKTL